MQEIKEKREIEDLFVLYSNDILRYALSLLRNLEDAKDVLQEVFLKYKLNESSFNHECSYKTWLFTITRNICYNKIQQHRNCVTQFDDLKLCRNSNISPEDFISLKEAMNKLTIDESEIIYLRDFEKYSYKELSDILGITIDNVKVRLFRVKQKLRKILER